jgi:hypothetical protein
MSVSSDTDNSSGKLLDSAAELASESEAESYHELNSTAASKKGTVHDDKMSMVFEEGELDPSAGLEKAKVILREYKDIISKFDEGDKEMKPNLPFMIKLMRLDASERRHLSLIEMDKASTHKFPHRFDIKLVMCFRAL